MRWRVTRSSERLVSFPVQSSDLYFFVLPLRRFLALGVYLDMMASVRFHTGELSFQVTGGRQTSWLKNGVVPPVPGILGDLPNAREARVHRDM